MGQHSAPRATTHRQVMPVVLAAALALGLVGLAVSSVTSAAWVDTTRNDGNSWAAGTVSLTDNDSGVAMFSATGLVPGETVQNSIVVTNAGTADLNVRLYGANLSDLNTLAQYLNVKVGTSAGAGDIFTGTLASFASTHTSYANGTAVVALAPAGTNTYHFWVELNAATPDTHQGASASIDFVWEGQTP